MRRFAEPTRKIGSPEDEHPPAPSPALRKLVLRAYRGRERVIRDIVARCRQIPCYRALSGPALQALHRTVGHLAAGFYRRSIIEGRVPTAQEMELPIRTARRRAADGVPLDEVVKAYQVGLRLLWAHLIATAAADPVVRPELLERVPVTLTAHSTVVTAVIEAYVEERGRLLGARTQAFEGFLRLLVAPETPLAVIERRAAVLGLRLDLCRSIVLFRPLASEDDHAAEANVEGLRGVLASSTHREGALIGLGRFEKDVLALLTLEPDSRALADLLARVPAHEWHIGLGGAGEGAPSLRRTVFEAQRAVAVGRLVHPSERVHRYADLALLDVVNVGSATAEGYAARVLGALARPGMGATYRRTLDAFLRHGMQRKVAAAALGIHPHTLSYRLNRLRERFGIDLDDYDVRLRVELALLILGATDGAPTS
jgi:sugar diacid utilization regulator